MNHVGHFQIRIIEGSVNGGSDNRGSTVIRGVVSTYGIACAIENYSGPRGSGSLLSLLSYTETSPLSKKDRTNG